MAVKWESLIAAPVLLHASHPPFADARRRVTGRRNTIRPMRGTMNVQDRRLEPVLLAVPGEAGQSPSARAQASSARPLTRADDGVARFAQPWAANPFSPAPLAGGWEAIVQSLLGILQQIMRLIGSPPADGYFTSATGSSTGDPHLQFDAAGRAGEVHRRFDSMSPHDDLLDSDSFTGGYQLSTKTTQPDARGIAWNQSATVTTGFGSTQVTLDASGDAAILQNGGRTAIAAGQTIDLGTGESVTRAQNGSLVITDDNHDGGTIETTLAPAGNGVDVRVAASDVDLGGDLAGAQIAPQPQPQPQPQPHPLPEDPWLHAMLRGIRGLE